MNNLQNSILNKGIEVNTPFTEGSMLPGAQLTSGSLVVGTEYVIGLFVAGDDFTNVGAFSNASGQRFLATGTTPTTWTNSSILRAQNVKSYDLTDGSEITLNNVHSTAGNKGHGVKWYSFDGVDDGMNLGDDDAFDFGTGDFTYVFRGTMTKDASDFSRLVSKLSTSGYEIYVNGSNNNIRFTITDGVDSYYNVYNNLFVDGEYLTLFFVVDKDDDLKVYKNGSLVTKSSTVGTLANVGDLDNAGDLYLARRDVGTFLECEMVLSGFFNYAVSAANILSWSTDIADGTFKMPWVDQGADNATLNVSTLVNGGGANAYTTFSGASATGFSATSDGGGTHLAGTPVEVVIVSGKKYRVSFDLVLNSGTAPDYGIYATLGGGNWTGDTQTSANGSNSYIFTATSGGTGVIQFRNATTTTDFVLSNLDVVEVGSTLSLSPDGIKDGTWIDYLHSEAYDASDPTFYRNSWSNSVWFNGTDSKMTFANDLTIPYTTGGLISFWLKRSITSTTHAILGRTSDAAKNLLLFAGGAILLESDTDTNQAQGTLIDDDTDWHHYVIIVDNGVVSMYQDGVSMTMTDASITDDIIFDEIGVRGASSNYLNGALGGLLIYDKSLIFTTDQDFVDLLYDSSK